MVDFVQVFIDNQQRVRDKFADKAAFGVIVVGRFPSTAIRQARTDCSVNKNISQGGGRRMAAGIQYLLVCVSDYNEALMA